MLQARNDKAKCQGQAPDGSQVCSDRGRCGRFLRPDGDRQAWGNYWKAGNDCQWYEIVPTEYHASAEEPAKVEWD